MTLGDADTFIAVTVVMLLVALVALMAYGVGRLDGAAKRREPMVVHLVAAGALEDLLDRRLDDIRQSGHPKLDPRARA